MANEKEINVKNQTDNYESINSKNVFSLQQILDEVAKNHRKPIDDLICYKII